MNRTFLPSLRETYTDHHSLVEQTEGNRPLLEEYRTLYTAALARLDQEEGVVLGISSPTAREGKTTVATNIAFAMAADLEKRVLLVSAGHSTEARDVEEENVRPGLAEYAADPQQRNLEELVVHTPLPDLCVLFAGARWENPSRLVRSERMREAVAGFRTHFDITVVDMPPILASSDAQVLASLMDGVLLVVGLGQSTMDAVERAVRMLEANRVIGIAANRAQPTLPRWMYRIMGGSEWAA